MRINTNVASQNTLGRLNAAQTGMSKSLEKLSSGIRINRASDDAAGLSISEKMRGQIKGLDRASANGQEAISLIQTADGALGEDHSILQRMRELAVQAASDTATNADRTEMQKEVDHLASEITRISNTTEFNTKNLLSGAFGGGAAGAQKFQIGANSNQNISLSIAAMDAGTLGVAGVDVALSNFAANGSNLAASGLSNVSQGFTTGTGYQIGVTVNAAAATNNADLNGTMGARAYTMTSYTASSDQHYMVRVGSASGTNITGAQYSTDNGSTWAAATVTSNVGNSDLVLGSGGPTVRVTDAAGNVTGNSFTFDAIAKNASLQLKDSGSANIGAAVTVHSNQSGTTLGDFMTNRSMDVSFSFATLASNTATFDLKATDATAAVTSGNGIVTTEALTGKGIDVSTQSAANNAITKINSAINTVAAQRSNLGAIQNRLEHTISNLAVTSENTTAAESRIRDVDMAAEMSSFTKNQILSQAATAMLAQANQVPQGILKLLG